MLVAEVFQLGDERGDGWRITEHPDPVACCLRVEPAGGALPEQGWKIHVSASLGSAAAVARAALPALRDGRATFKILRSVGDLAALNRGSGGVTQIGKFITVYPEDEDRFVSLALALAARTRGLAGPAVPSDRRVAPGAVVFYRYGGFGPRTFQTPLGRVAHALRAPDGSLVEDDRGSSDPPPWATDPLLARGLVPTPERESPLVGGRYLRVGLLHRSPKGGVYVGIDLDDPEHRSCVIKEARRHVLPTGAGGDATTLLENERALLDHLGEEPSVPRLFDFVEESDRALLVIEYISGTTLQEVVLSKAASGRRLSTQRIVELGRRLCEVLGALHRRGVLHRDLKAGNWILAEDGRLRLIDLELAYHPDLSSERPGAGSGTRGYRSPEQASGAPPSPADDVYGLGSLLYFLCTFSDPAPAAREWSSGAVPMARFNPEVSGRLEAIVLRCLADAEARYQTAAEVADALAVLDTEETVAISLARDEAPSDANATGYLELAVGVGEHLCASADAMPKGGVSWVSTHPSSAGRRLRSITSGASGIALMLIELYRERGDARFRSVAEAALRWLLEPDDPPPRHPGLFVGESGVGLVCLRAGEVFGDDRYRRAARDIAGRVAESLPASPDLYNGLAGCGLFLLNTAEALGDDELRERALAVGRRLARWAPDVAEAGWVLPDGYADLSGKAWLGFSHGSAGIAYFLLELAEATGDASALRRGLEAADRLAALAEPALSDGSGVNWPDFAGGPVRSLFWCHGACGIGRFLLRAFALAGQEEHLELARRAGRLVALGGRWAGAGQCHGLAGNIELLLDLHRATGEPEWRRFAGELAAHLRTQAVPCGERFVWTSEQPNIVTPEYMVGYSGVGACFLRLARERDAYWFSRAHCLGSRDRPPSPLAKMI